MSATWRILSLIAAATALAAGSAQAAVLTTAGDTSYVDSGRGFKPVPSRSTVYPGDVISVGPKGRATLVYNNGCAFTVRPKRPVTVARTPPTCAGARSGSTYSRADAIIGTVTMTSAFGTIIYKAAKSGPSSP